MYCIKQGVGTFNRGCWDILELSQELFFSREFRERPRERPPAGDRGPRVASSCLYRQLVNFLLFNRKYKIEVASMNIPDNVLGIDKEV